MAYSLKNYFKFNHHTLYQGIKNDFIKPRLTTLLQQYSCRETQKCQESRNKNDVRYEEYTPLGKSVLQGTKNLTIPHVIFKIMDYNILSQTHMKTHIRNYQGCHRECLNWDYRKPVLTEEFLAEKPDILCLQEVEGAHGADLLEPLRKLGFDALYVPREHNKPDGCALLFKTSVFRVADFSPVRYFQPHVPLLNRPNVGMVARLELQSHPGHCVVVANTHLLYNPKRIDIKLSQLQILLAETERLAYNPAAESMNKYHPVVLTGDLNVNERSGLIQLLSQGHFNCEQLATRHRRPGMTRQGGLLRRYLNISEDCQFLDVINAREEGHADPRTTKELENLLRQHRMDTDNCFDTEVKKSKPLGSHFVLPTPESQVRDEEESDESPSSEIIRHGFQFVNVNSHPYIDKTNRRSSRNTDRKLSVYDYMFYSSETRHQVKSSVLRPGQLELLSRQRLPSFSEYNAKFRCIPNYACGSDHLPLTATFLLPI